MGYEIRIAEPVEQAIRRLKARIRNEVLRGIEEAAASLDQHSRVAVGPYEGLPCYWFQISMPPKVIRVACVFQYSYIEDREAIDVLAVGESDGDNVALPPGAFSSA